MVFSPEQTPENQHSDSHPTLQVEQLLATDPDLLFIQSMLTRFDQIEAVPVNEGRNSAQGLRSNQLDLLHTDPEQRLEMQKFADEVIQFLTPLLADKGIQPIRADRNIRNGHTNHIAVKYPLVDILFASTDPNLGLHLPGIRIYGWAANMQELSQYSNVGGLTVVPDGCSLAAQKQYARLAARELNRLYPGNKTVMNVSPELLRLWQTQIDPVLDQPDVRPSRKSIDYGSVKLFRETEPTVDLFIYEPGGKSHIGGTQLTIVAKYETKGRKDTIKRAVQLDAGWVFSQASYLGNLMSAPRFKDGIAPFLNLGLTPPTRRLYRLDLLLNSLRPSVFKDMAGLSTRPVDKTSFYSNNEFIFLEVFHRLKEEGLLEFLQANSPELVKKLHQEGLLLKILVYARKREQVLYREKTIFDGVALSHAHQDHSLLISLFREEIPVILTETTRVLCLADFLKSTWLASEVIALRQRNLGRTLNQSTGTSSYPAIERPYYAPQEGVRTEIAPNTFITLFDTYHSIPGTAGFVLEIEFQNKVLASIAYPGDYRNATFFQKVAEQFGMVDFVFFEGTNPQFVTKDSAQYTEAMVAENFAATLQEVNEAGKLLLVDIIKNNYERLENIISAAVQAGRQVVISPTVAKRAEPSILLHTQPETMKLPDLFSDKIALWHRHQLTTSPDELRGFMNYGSVTDDEIAANPEKFVLIRDSNEHPDSLGGLPRAQVVWVRSSYGPYDPAARSALKAYRQFAEQRDWIFLTKGYHSTGHATLLQPDHPNATSGLLAELDSIVGKHGLARKAIVGHTQFREKTTDLFKAYPNIADKIEFIERLPHPMAKIPLHVKK